MCLMALMGAVLSALLKANSIQNRPLAREVDGSCCPWVCSLRDSWRAPRPSHPVDGGVLGR